MQANNNFSMFIFDSLPQIPRIMHTRANQVVAIFLSVSSLQLIPQDPSFPQHTLTLIDVFSSIFLRRFFKKSLSFWWDTIFFILRIFIKDYSTKSFDHSAEVKNFV